MSLSSNTLNQIAELLCISNGGNNSSCVIYVDYAVFDKLRKDLKMTNSKVFNTTNPNLYNKDSEGRLLFSYKDSFFDQTIKVIYSEDIMFNHFGDTESKNDLKIKTYG